MSEVTYCRIPQTLPIDMEFGLAQNSSSDIACSIGAVLPNRKENAASIGLQGILETFVRSLWHGPYARVSLELGCGLGGLSVSQPALSPMSIVGKVNLRTRVCELGCIDSDWADGHGACYAQLSPVCHSGQCDMS